MLQSPLIGRDGDLAELLPYVDAAAAGTGAMIVLSGEGGVGKTKLAETLGEEAARRGFRVAAGRAYAAESGVPYALFADALMPIVREMDTARLAALARGAQAELSIVLPGIGGGQRPHADSPDELRGRVLWSTTEFVRGLSAAQPLMLLLDDLHWADLSSLELVHFLARHVAQCRVLIVGTFNESERGQRPELRSFEQSLLGRGIAHVHTVGPLSRDETAELIRRAFGADPSVTRDFAALLYGWTRGNAFFVRETLQALVESGKLRRRADGQWLGWESAELQLPGSVREAILSRLERAGATTRDVADAAAVMGARFDHELLRSVVTISDDELLHAIDELRRLNVIHESAAGAEVRYDFVHPLLRQVLYTELGVARVRTLHAAVARALEQRYDSDAGAHADELAHHFARAASDALRPKALQYLHAAGRNALDRFADREAVEYLRLARDAWTADAPVAEAAIVSDLARAHQRVGDYDAAIALWHELLPERADESNAADAADLLRRIGQAFYWGGRHAEALEQYTAGLRLVADTGTADEAVLRLAAGVSMQELGRADAAKHEIEHARAISEQLNDTALLARTHRALLLLHIWTGPPDEARRHGSIASQLAREAGDISTEFYSIWGLAVLEGLTGRVSVMAEHLSAAEHIAEQQRSPLLRLWTDELAIELAAALGEWDRGIGIGEKAIGLARSLNQRTLLPRLLVWTALIHIGRGELGPAEAYVDEAWEISRADFVGQEPVDVHTVVPAHIGRAALHLACRRFNQAIAVCQRGLDLADRTGYAFWAMHRLLPILAEAHCYLWDVEGALAVERRIRAEAERLGHRIGLAWADSCRALAVWLGGDPAGAIRLLRDACAALEAIPMLPDAARLRRQLAGRLAETGDRAGALQELRHVHDIFVRLGAESELAKAREMFREIGAKPPLRATAAGAEGLTGREIEIARMVADRKSNKAIGRTLDISPRTVSTHLSNIFRKLEVASRGELADYVRRHGLG